MEENSRESNEGAPKSIIPGGENDYFVCNICLGSVHDPVVTLCGHLYCWPCIYQRLRDANQPKTCLICNAEISLTSLVPLFGRGVSNSDSVARSNHMGLEIPPRPIPNNLTYMPTFPTNAPTYHQNQQLHDAASFPFPFHSNEVWLNFSNIRIYMLGQILATTRNEMEAHNFLNRAFIFLLCCVILCLLLF